MRTLLPLLLTAACVEQSGLQCPPNTSIVGQYTLAFTAQHDAGECVWYPVDPVDPSRDAGSRNFALDDAGASGSTLCVGTASDGGPQLQLLTPGKGGARKSDLSPDGGFHFATDPDPVLAQGTTCKCDVLDSETFDGYLQTSAGFALRPDGGLPPISGLTATLTDRLSAAPGGTTQCRCNLPCSFSYSIRGTTF
jgi:hypothetical protein